MGQQNATDPIVNSHLAAIYCRVSSERQEKEGTIQSQLSELERIAAENGDIVVGRYLDDGYSGELLERPALDKLRNDAGKKLFDKVYILSPDRLARKHHYGAIILEDLARNGVKVIFSNRPVGESVEDRLLFNIQSVFADYEKAKILDRLRRGKIFKMKQGNVLGNVPPYGYKYVKAENNSRRAWYEVNEGEAEVVRFIFSCYISEECSGIGGLRRKLYRRKIKNRHGSNRWSQSMVARILSNETYTGTTHWGKYRSVENRAAGGYRRLKNTARVRRSREEWLPIKVPPIIDDTTFSAAKVKRASNKCLSCSTVRHNYLLKGLMRCQECGSLMYSKSCHGTSYYVCGKKRNSFPDDAPCGNTRHFRGEPLDEAIWTEFRRIILSPDVLLDRVRHRALDGAGEKQAVEIQMSALNTKILGLQEKRRKLIDAYTNDIIPMGELRNRIDELENEIKVLRSEQNVLSDQQASEPANDIPDEEKLAAFTAQVKQVIDGDDFQMKQRLARHFLNSITLSDQEATVSASLPRTLSCVPMSTASSELGQSYTGYGFEFRVRIQTRRHRKRTALPMAANG